MSQQSGTAAVSSPDSPVPSPLEGDMQRDAAADYAVNAGTCRAWIRRAVHSERFGKSLETELEKLRAEKQGLPQGSE